MGLGFSTAYYLHKVISLRAHPIYMPTSAYTGQKGISVVIEKKDLDRLECILSKPEQKKK